MAFQFIAPRAALSRADGICRIGIQPAAAETMIVFDTALNFTLTGIFIWQLRKSFSSLIKRSSKNVGQRRKSLGRFPAWQHGLSSTGISSSENNIRLMLIRNVVGCVLLTINTIVNKATFLTRDFALMAHACLLMCLTDSMSILSRSYYVVTNKVTVVVGMLITHWLSMRSSGGKTAPPRHASHHQGADSGRPSMQIWRSSKGPDALEFAHYNNNEKPAPISSATFPRNDCAINISLR
jgi:hypothetical protein